MEQIRGNLGGVVKASMPEASSAKGAVASTFTAIVLAGSRYGDDSFASQYGQKYKALIPVCGQPMVLRVINALRQSRSVGRIIVVFNCQDSLLESCPELEDLFRMEEVTITPCAVSISDSVMAGLKSCENMGPYLVTTADHALLTPAMIDEFCSNAHKDSPDLAVGLVEKKFLDKEHPSSCRTYLPFKGTKLSGANMFGFMTADAQEVLKFWKIIEQQRKKPWKLFSAFGWRNLLGLMMKRYTVEEAFERASKVVGVRARAIRLPFAEAAIDVDTAIDHAQVTKILEVREAAAVRL